MVKIKETACSEYAGCIAIVISEHPRRGGFRLDYRLSVEGKDVGWFWADELELTNSINAAIV